MGKLDAIVTAHSLLVRETPIPCQELLTYYLGRIEKFDKGQGRVNSVIEVNPSIETIAKRVDDLKALGRSAGSLAGAPILLKDNIETADCMLTAAGSLALNHKPAKKEATLATRLRDQGALLMGKTNMSEWANFRSTTSISGWSSRGGQTRNPYNLFRSPNGSSSGSAAAVAADFCLAAIGTETDGSVVYPAAACGVVGFKPSRDLIPTDGIVPISARQDHAGILCRDVATAILVFRAISNQHSPIPLSAPGSNSIRVGLLPEYTPNNAAQLWEDAIVLLEGLGFQVSQAKPLPRYVDFSNDYWTLLKNEFYTSINSYLHLRNQTVTSLQELVDFNQRNAQTVLARFGQEILVDLPDSLINDLEYGQLLKKTDEHLRTNGLDASLEGYNLLAAITCPEAPELNCQDRSLLVGESLASIPAFCGYPHITLPLGYIDGLPINISLIARPHTDLHLLKTAALFEQSNPVRTAPTGFLD